MVTADLESHVVVVELGTGRVVAEVSTDDGPRSIESVAATCAVIAHTQIGIVSVLDARSLRVRARLRDFREPRYTAADAGGRYAFVSDSGRQDVARVDMLRGEVSERLALGGPARHVSLSPSGRLLWVALGSKAEQVAVVDVEGRRLRLVARIDPPFLAHDVGFTPGGRTVWVTSGDRGAIAIYTAGGNLIRRLSADAPPQHVTFLDGAAHVTSGDDGTLRVHSLRDARILRETRIPVGSYNVQRAGGRVLTPSLDRGTLCVLDVRGVIQRRIQVAASSHDACFVLRG